jgi:hypothetical protein
MFCGRPKMWRLREESKEELASATLERDHVTYLVPPLCVGDNMAVHAFMTLGFVPSVL